MLPRFMRNNIQHPTYKALAELGRAVKTIFLRRYLNSEALRREIREGLNVVESRAAPARYPRRRIITAVDDLQRAAYGEIERHSSLTLDVFNILNSTAPDVTYHYGSS